MPSRVPQLRAILRREPTEKEITIDQLARNSTSSRDNHQIIYQGQEGFTQNIQYRCDHIDWEHRELIAIRKETRRTEYIPFEKIVFVSNGIEAYLF